MGKREDLSNDVMYDYENSLLEELLVLARKITKETKTDVFVNYSGHIDCISVHYHENGWKEGCNDSVNIIYPEVVSSHVLEKALDGLKELERRVRQ